MNTDDTGDKLTEILDTPGVTSVTLTKIMDGFGVDAYTVDVETTGRTDVHAVSETSPGVAVDFAVEAMNGGTIHPDLA